MTTLALTGTLGRSRTLALALLLTLVCLSAILPGAQAQTTPNPRVYTVELIVFRNMSGLGGPEDWSVKPVARGPDTPDAPVTGRFVQSVSPAHDTRRPSGNCWQMLSRQGAAMPQSASMVQEVGTPGTRCGKY